MSRNMHSTFDMQVASKHSGFQSQMTKLEREQNLETQNRLFQERIFELEAEVKELKSSNEIHKLKMQKFKFESKCLRKKLESTLALCPTKKPLKVQNNVYFVSLNSSKTKDSDQTFSSSSQDDLNDRRLRHHSTHKTPLHKHLKFSAEKYTLSRVRASVNIPIEKLENSNVKASKRQEELNDARPGDGLSVPKRKKNLHSMTISA